MQFSLVTPLREIQDKMYYARNLPGSVNNNFPKFYGDRMYNAIFLVMSLRGIGDLMYYARNLPGSVRNKFPKFYADRINDALTPLREIVASYAFT
jgi:hypothetical protein